MRGNKIIVSANPKGHIEDIVISGTPLPGTHMEIVPGTNPNAGGLFTYRARTGTDGAKGPLCILLEDDLQGKTYADAYVSAKIGHVYWPIPGEEFNLLIRDQPGTGTVGMNNVGDTLSVDGATGYLQPAGSLASAPYWLLDDLTVDVSAAQLAWVKCIGLMA